MSGQRDQHQRRGLDAAFGGIETTLDEQRTIWLEALHEDAIWEGPTFETPIYIVGRAAVGRFMEYLLEVVPKFSTELVAAHPTDDPETVIIESIGGGDTIYGGTYQQRYFSTITTRDGRAFRMREYCNPFQTYKAFGRERWDARIAEIVRDHNVDWPASQPPDRARLPNT
ncbi:MAG: nuclear transport factor 2 family protein [Pseudomonadota bacterium]